MKKLKLNLDDLKVESFETTPAALSAKRGTVHGFDESWDTECTTCDPTAFNPPTCNGFTCWQGCQANTIDDPTCWASCIECPTGPTCNKPTCP